ncbi:MAG TPA: hypothetical protein VL069_06980 [Opitutus sp.]|nr:hypothetical protein [Opitutus sp.]
MTAAEIIELIKMLPPEEKAEVIAFLRNGNESGRVEETEIETRVDYLPHEEAKRRAAEIFRENHDLFRRLAQ